MQTTRQGKVNGNGRRAGGGRLEPGGKSNTAGRPRLAAGHNSHEICKDAHHPLILRLILHGINPKMNYPLACLPPPRGAPTPLHSTLFPLPSLKSQHKSRETSFAGFAGWINILRQPKKRNTKEEKEGRGRGEAHGVGVAALDMFAYA